MNKLITIIYLIPLVTFSQSYAPPAGQQGSTAIHMESQAFVSWASGISVERGFVNLEDTTFEAVGSNRASYGDPQNALGPSTGSSADVISLGDSGVAVLTFEHPITNGPGFDFAVFENSFSDDYLEFAHVEVSSDGVNFIRFPSHSEVQSQVQIHGFGLTDTRRINNLAGKYRVGYGTPFDLEELIDSSQVDVNNITHVKIIDVIGSVGQSGTFDSFGNKINEPFSTPYESGGFDLEALGVLNEMVSTKEFKDENFNFTVYPNPSNGIINIKTNNFQPFKIKITNGLGQVVFQHNYDAKQNVNNIPLLKSGYYIIHFTNKSYQKQRIVTVK
jgi:hypothetical protein